MGLILPCCFPSGFCNVGDNSFESDWISQYCYLESIVDGSHVTISGKIVINAAKRLIKKKNGSAALVMEKISWPVIPWRTNKLNPRGGVIWAISIMITIKIPNQILSKPALSIIGKTTEVVRTIMEKPSMKQPMIE